MLALNPKLKNLFPPTTQFFSLASLRRHLGALFEYVALFLYLSFPHWGSSLSQKKINKEYFLILDLIKSAHIK